jgi:DNA-binding transcriptional LysR family regulator
MRYAAKALLTPTFEITTPSVEALLATGRARPGVPVLPADSLAAFSPGSVRLLVDQEDHPISETFCLYYRGAEAEREAIGVLRARSRAIIAESGFPGLELA